MKTSKPKKQTAAEVQTKAQRRAAVLASRQYRRDSIEAGAQMHTIDK